MGPGWFNLLTAGNQLDPIKTQAVIKRTGQILLKGYYKCTLSIFIIESVYFINLCTVNIICRLFKQSLDKVTTKQYCACKQNVNKN